MWKALLASCAIAVLAAAPMSSAAGGEGGGGVTTLAAGGNAFALELYAKLAEEQKGNLFFSPFSLSSALAMTYAGARGQTAAQMAKVLHFALEAKQLHPAFQELNHAFAGGGKDRGYQLDVANALWGQKGYRFLEEFLQLTRTYYGAGLNEVDFQSATEAARQTINRWVEEKTREKIKELIKRRMLTPLTTLVLTNAIYFKGDWVAKFDKEKTKDEPFTLPGGEKVPVPTMTQKKTFNYAEGADAQVLELPYVGKDLSMVVFLPNRPDGLAAFEKGLTSKGLADRMAALRGTELVVALPRFKVTSEFKLGQTLAAVGMPDAFALGRADFSGMTGSKDLAISEVVHKAYVEVNEEGTEAAAASAVIMFRGGPRPMPVFRADHPFLFAIRHNPTGSILFLGRVVNPKD